MSPRAGAATGDRVDEREIGEEGRFLVNFARNALRYMIHPH